MTSVAAAPPRAVADHAMTAEFFPWTLYGELYVGGEEILNGNMDDRNSVEVHEKMSN